MSSSTDMSPNEFFDELAIIFKEDSRSDSGYVHHLELIKQMKEEKEAAEMVVEIMKNENEINKKNLITFLKDYVEVATK